MARRPAYKKIHCVRAIYNDGQHPEESFSESIRLALITLPTVADTRVNMRTLGAVGVRQRHSEWQNPDHPLLIAIGAGPIGEALGTFGANAATDGDDDAPEDPPQDRAFKLAEAFVLIDGDDLLVCTDGSIRGYNTVGRYLHALLEAANLSPDNQAFYLNAVSDVDQVTALRREGVANMTLKSTLHAATIELQDNEEGIGSPWQTFRSKVRRFFAEEITDEAEKEVLSRHWGEVNVVTTISPAGGRSAEPVLLKSIDGAAVDILEESPDDSEVIIKTRHGNTIKSGDVLLSKPVTLRRKERQNDLNHIEVWQELLDYMDELIDQRIWQL